MLYLINLLFSQLFPGILDWILRLNAAVSTSSRPFGPVDTAKALSAIAAILILGLGGVLIISLSGRWLRRNVFKSQSPKVEPSEESKIGKLNWATYQENETDRTSSVENRNEDS